MMCHVWWVMDGIHILLRWWNPLAVTTYISLALYCLSQYSLHQVGSQIQHNACLVSCTLPYRSSSFFFLLLCRLDETYFHASIYYLNQFVLVLSFFHFLFFLTFCLLLTVFSLFSCYCPLLFREPDLDQYSALIMDEAHERLPFFLSFLLSIDIYI